MKKQTGRSMIEMLAVLAVIAVLSIGGLLGYRRAVNNHHANVILDDVNRFAFVILEKSGMPLGEDIDKGDFKESGLYQLTGFQGEDAGQFAITVKNVPKGVCEPLLTKAITQYKVGFVIAGGSRDDEILYDTLNTDLCQEMNDMTFYFGDTSLVCNEPDESGYTPCTANSDCCDGEFCWIPPNQNCSETDGGTCKLISSYNPETAILFDGNKWTRSRKRIGSWWSARNWCQAQGLNLASRIDAGCKEIQWRIDCSDLSILQSMPENWKNGGVYYYLEEKDSCDTYGFDTAVYAAKKWRNNYALCH